MLQIEVVDLVSDNEEESPLTPTLFSDNALRVEDEPRADRASPDKAPTLAVTGTAAAAAIPRPKPRPRRSDPSVPTVSTSTSTSPTLDADEPADGLSSLSGWKSPSTRPRQSDESNISPQRPAKRQRQHSQSGVPADRSAPRLSLSPPRNYSAALATHLSGNVQANGGGPDTGSANGAEVHPNLAEAVVSEDDASPGGGNESDDAMGGDGSEDVEAEGEQDVEQDDDEADDDDDDDDEGDGVEGTGGDDDGPDGEDAEEEDEDDDSEEDDDDDDDETGSVDLEGSPIFISSTRPLGILDLVEGPVQVKQETADGDVEMGSREAVGLGLVTEDGAAVGQPGEASGTAAVPGEGGATGEAGDKADGEPIPNVLVAKKPQRKKLIVPSTPPPVIPKQIVTIRLDIDLGGQSKTHLVNFKETAKEKNVVPADYFDEVLAPKPPGAMGDDEDQADGASKMPVAAAGPTPVPTEVHIGAPSLFGGSGLGDADEEEMKRIAAELEKKYDKPVSHRRAVRLLVLTRSTIAQGKKRKKAVIDRYDTHDPFIDDSELKFDEPTYYIRPKKDGYYVQKGPVELMGQT